MPHASDVSPDDEVKVYQVEGEGEDEERSSAENLKEVKTSLVTEVVEEEEQHRKNVPNFIPSSKPSRSLAEPISPHLPGKHFEYLPPTFGYVVSPYHPHPNGPYGAISMPINRRKLELLWAVVDNTLVTVSEDYLSLRAPSLIELPQSFFFTPASIFGPLSRR
ncbi:hypothetical protein AVEN_233084-1 [Araneus ventricosus]|uniref:CTNNB1 binding N-teminal domain-containing protein n=1 Tax=Araneus ventricosus TaxID=182803 RepID=A0A4Y2IFJ0_ARAVE|nr:hypothetical protein AVEN_233084-1 [Araneus ventricosus]